MGVLLGLLHVPRYFVLDAELFAFKFKYSEIVGMRPVLFFVDCVFDGRVFGPQRRDTLICWHSEPPMSPFLVRHYASLGGFFLQLSDNPAPGAENGQTSG